MNLSTRIEAFYNLGKYTSNLSNENFNAIAIQARNENAWFTAESIKSAFDALEHYLSRESLMEWASKYSIENQLPKTIALVMAGNIPLVGFHDMLSILIAGHTLQVKLSSKDSVLPKFFIEKLIELEPGFKSKIFIAEQIRNFDAVIATGSDNAARYFNYYFSKYPHIIRKNRTSCAILTGNESSEELTRLGKDVFTYFGLGCRNVSKLFVPAGYDFTKLFEAWDAYKSVTLHHKYHNNYEYQKSILLVNRMPFLDAGFVMLQSSEKLVSPISVVFYEAYSDEGDLALKLMNVKDKIQCVVGKATLASVPFGQAQSPALWDYADQVDTLKFLTSLN